MGETPAAGPARLAERDLAAIEQRWMRTWDRGQRLDAAAVLDALRAAWAENARYRAGLEHYADEATWWTQINDMQPMQHYRPWPSPFPRGYDVARAALAAPGAGEGGEA